MAVVANSTARAELAELRAAGVVGVTLNAVLLGVEYDAYAARLLANLAALDMIADVQVIDDQLVALAPLLERSGVRVHVDHCARPDPTAGPRRPGLPRAVPLGRDRPGGGEAVRLRRRSPASPTRTRDLLPFIHALVSSSGPTAACGARTGPSCACPTHRLRPSARALPGPGARRRRPVAPPRDTPCRAFGFPR